MNIDTAWLAKQFADLSSLTPLVQGGQKSVYTACHTTDGNVVLKIIHPSQDPERVRREILAVQKANCPRVPRILGTGILQTNIGEVLWVREQRISGDSVRSILAARSLAKSEVVTLAIHILEALADAERVQIVHRDVKPDNIIRDREGNFWLLDFGIARHLDLTSVTGTQSPFGVGTAGYASPEQFRNQKRDIDGRADLFAVGVTLYECASGLNPFRVGARDDLEILRNVERMALPELPQPFADFGTVVKAFTQKRPDHRPRSTAEGLKIVQEFCQRTNFQQECKH